jgi:outer membrane protein assembly factor BamB
LNTRPALPPWLSATFGLSALFCLFVAGYMVYQHLVASDHDPWTSPRLLALKEQLRAAPADETLRAEIRRLDLEFRQRYVRRLSIDVTGGWMLVAGFGVLVFAASRVASLRTPAWLPRLDHHADRKARASTRLSLWSVAVLGTITIITLAALAFLSKPPPAVSTDTDSAPPPEVSIAEFHANWPRFRGPDGSGATARPLDLDLSQGLSNAVLWSSPIPVSGFNSPVIWSNRVFLSGGDAQKREVCCYDASLGTLLWRRAIENVPGSPATQPELYDQPGFAAPTTATDGQRVFVMFANGDLAAFTAEGTPAWSKNVGLPRNPYGYATSLALWPGYLVVQLDQNEGAPGGSRLMAFDCARGRLLWEQRRDTFATWASPIILQAAGSTQVITLGNPQVISYSLDTGSELWRAGLLEGEITPSPLFAGGQVIVVSPSTSLIAIRPEGRGDVTKTHVAWTTHDDLPDITSPVADDTFLYVSTSAGSLAWYDLKTGKRAGEKRLGLDIQSSPGLAQNQLVVLSTRGDVLLLDARDNLKELGRAQLNDPFYASPAFANGRLYLRGTTNLWCLGPR